MSFLVNLQKNIEEIATLKRTENGAIGYSTTGKKLLDMNFNVASYRKCTEREIVTNYEAAYNENALLAILWAFFVRDVRGGLGERRLFRILFRHLIKINPEIAVKLLPMISEYGRWDDLVKTTIKTTLWNNAVELISTQMQSDVENCKNGNSISLLAKWLPSERTSSRESRVMARTLASALGMDIIEYNKTLVMLRKHLDIVESKMSAKEWSEIDYSAVPSKANLIYNNAFLRNDEERRRAYLAALSKGETKINASTLFPHEIVHKYSKGGAYWNYGVKPDVDDTLESLWKALPASKGLENVMVVVDGSGSMCTKVDSKSGVTALEVSNALGIYCSQFCTGEYKDKFITFSSRPQFVDLSMRKSLHAKLSCAYKHDDCSNTNIEKVFDIILRTALDSGASQEEMPNTILVVSDMEFDEATCGAKPDKALFKIIGERYKEHGYELPRLVFWNVNSCTKTIPIRENENGVTLVSGFSTGIMQMVTNGQTDPYLNLVETITGKRYQPIIEALK